MASISKACTVNGNKALVILFLILAVLAFIPSAEAAVQVYCIKNERCYSGPGYVMSYDGTFATRQMLRVAFSVNKPSYQIGDSVQNMIRTDGYFFQDSGWWYIVKGASVKVWYYYPNGTLIAGKNITTTTGSDGLWSNSTALFLTYDYPMGRYKVNASVTGPSSGGPGTSVNLAGVTISGANMAVYFDVGGHLNVSVRDIPDGNKGSAFKINGTVYQPNGKAFNSTFLNFNGLSVSSYWVNLSITRPDLTIDRYNFSTPNGSFYFSYNPPVVGKYYAVAHVEYDMGNQTMTGRHTVGRNFQTFVVYGSWPEVGLSFASSPVNVAVLLFLTHLLRRRGLGR